MVLLSIILDFVQEHRAGRAAERLRQAAHVRVAVLRDGSPSDILLTDVVPGDVVLFCRAIDPRRWPPARSTGSVRESGAAHRRALPRGEGRRMRGHGRPRQLHSPEEPQAVLMGTVDRQRHRRAPSSSRPVRRPASARSAPLSSGSRRPRPSSKGRARSGLLILQLALIMVLFVHPGERLARAAPGSTPSCSPSLWRWAWRRSCSRWSCRSRSRAARSACRAGRCWSSAWPPSTTSAAWTSSAPTRPGR